MPRGILYILAKDPAPGFVKTRLCPPLGPEQASALAAAFAADILYMAGTLREVDVRLALDPFPPGLAGAGERGGGFAGEGAARVARELPGGRVAFPGGLAAFPGGLAAEAAARGFAVEGQGGGDLGRRMEALMARGLASGPTVLIGTDCPDLPASLVEAAFAALGRADAVLVPAADGGYVLVGARRPLPTLFAIDAPWGSERVFAATVDALSRAGCAFEALEIREDVDDARALGRLASRLDEAGEGVAPQTARLLARWRDEGVRF